MYRRNAEFGPQNTVYPLGKFSHFVVGKLPVFNRQEPKDVREFLRRGVALLPSPDEVAEVAADGSSDLAALALGDLGMFASTLSRNGLPPAQASSNLVDHLLFLSSKTGLPPRDNYYSYTEVNLPGAHARTYTGHPEEHLMVFYNDQFCSLFRPTSEILVELSSAKRWSSEDTEVKTRFAARRLYESNRLMLAVRQNISAEVFSSSRKFTAPIEIPGAVWNDDKGEPTSIVTNIDADSNIALIDLVLYGVDETHLNYLQQLYQYFPTFRKEAFEQLVNEHCRSLEERFMDERDDLSPATSQNIIDIFKQMWGWRNMHNSAVTTHLRMKGKGQNPDRTGFEYDSKLTRLINRSKDAYQRVAGLS